MPCQCHGRLQKLALLYIYIFFSFYIFYLFVCFWNIIWFILILRAFLQLLLPHIFPLITSHASLLEAYVVGLLISFFHLLLPLSLPSPLLFTLFFYASFDIFGKTIEIRENPKERLERYDHISLGRDDRIFFSEVLLEKVELQ